MAGYKKSVELLKPLVFITFDGDTLYNPSNGELIYRHITDESNNGNDAILQTNSDLKKSYLMGQPSLVERENNAGQASFTFAPFSYDLDKRIDFPYEKSLVEILHNETLSLKDDYSIMFHFNKYSDEGFLRGIYWDEPSKTYKKRTTSNTSTFKRTFIRKGAPIEIYYKDIWSYQDVMGFSFPGYNVELNINTFIGSPNFFNTTWHCTVTHRIIRHAGNIYQHEYTVYMNGIIVHQKLSEKIFKPYTAQTVNPIEIGGNRDATDPNNLNDRQTTPLTIDQIAIFDRFLSPNEVMDCYKKTVSYINLIKKADPKLYIMFDDKESSNTNSLNIEVGQSSNYQASYSNNYPFVKKEQIISSNRIGTERGVEFFNANAKVQDLYNSSILNVSGDYTIEFWASFSDIDRCIIVSCQSNLAPFKGILIEGNRFHKLNRPGMIQIRFGENTFLTAPEHNEKGGYVSYNDGVVRHYAIVRKNTTTYLYIDGVVVNSIEMAVDNLVSSNYGVLYFMGMSPSNIYTKGIIGQFAFYHRALGIQEIVARSFFNIKMVIKGRVTLQGIPYKCNIRIYNHITGNLLNEYTSDNNGDYSLNIYTNNFVDVVFLDVKNSDVQMRVIGPIIAHEYIDY